MYNKQPGKAVPDEKTVKEDDGSSVDPEKLDELVKNKYLDQLSQTKPKVCVCGG